MSSTSIRSYRDLMVWQQGMDLTEAVYRATQRFPDTERYGLIAQLRRAAVSVVSNIAEGHSRSIGDYVRHLLVSAGSLTELETQLLLSARLGFLPQCDADALLRRCDEVGRMLSVLRKRLQSRRALVITPSP